MIKIPQQKRDAYHLKNRLWISSGGKLGDLSVVISVGGLTVRKKISTHIHTGCINKKQSLGKN